MSTVIIRARVLEPKNPAPAQTTAITPSAKTSVKKCLFIAVLFSRYGKQNSYEQTFFHARLCAGRDGGCLGGRWILGLQHPGPDDDGAHWSGLWVRRTRVAPLSS